MIIPDPYNRGQYIDTDRPRAKDDYSSYSDKRRARSLGAAGLTILGAGALTAAYFHKTAIGSGFLTLLEKATKKVIGQAGTSATNSARISEAHSIENRMVRELSRTIRSIHAREYSSQAARAVLNESSLTTTFTTANIRKAFGLGKEVNGQIIPDGKQFSGYRALRSTFFKPLDTRPRFDILYEKFAKLAQHSDVHELIQGRVAQHQALGLTLQDSTSKAYHEFAHGMASAHATLSTPEAIERFQKLGDVHAQQIINSFTDNVLTPIVNTHENSTTNRLLKSIGASGRVVNSDKNLTSSLSDSISKLGKDIDTSTLKDTLGKLTNNNIITLDNGKQVNLSMGKTAVSKVYNKFREQLQIPVAPFQGGFSLFSFFPHLRGQTNQFIHVVDSRNPLAFIDDVLKKSQLPDTSSLGSFVVMGNKEGLSGFRGKGFFIGGGAIAPSPSLTTSEHLLAQAEANKALQELSLNVRDAKSGWLKEVNDWATKSLISRYYEKTPQGILGKIFFPGGKEESDNLFNKYLGVFKKFKDPDYLPNVWRDKVLKGSPDPSAINHLSRALKGNSGSLDASRLLEELNKNGEITNIVNNTPLHPDLKDLLLSSEGLKSDSGVLTYFSAQARDFESIIKDPTGGYSNPALKANIAGFRTSVETAFGYGRNNDPYHIGTELGIDYLRGTLGESAKSQGLDNIREQILAELDLKSGGQVARLLRTTEAKVFNKDLHQAHLLGHEISQHTDNGLLHQAVELFRPSEFSREDAILASSQNRDIVDQFLKRRYPLTGTNWKTESQLAIESIKRSGGSPEAIQKALEGIPSEGADTVRGRYLITQASTSPSNPLDYLFDFKGSVNRAKDTLTSEFDNAKSLFSNVKDWFAGESPEARREAVLGIQEDSQKSVIGRRLDYWNRGIDSGSNFRLSLLDPYFLTSRLNKFMGPIGLSLGTEDMTSPGKILNALTFKRVLPGLGIIRGLDYLDYKADQRDDDNSPDNLVANLRANTDLINARFSDKLGLTSFKKKLADLLPGSEQYLNFAPKTEEEYSEYLTSGRDPVRKSRGWLFGSRTPYAGTSIAYYEPNFYQRSHSDYESAPGGRKSKETFFLETGSLNSVENRNSTGLFAPRPYVYSSPLVDPNVIGGNFINATLGAILKPQKLLNDPNPYLAYHSNGISELGTESKYPGTSVDGNESSPELATPHSFSSGSFSTEERSGSGLGDHYNSSSGLNIFSTPGVVPGPRVRQLGANVLRITSSGNFTPKNTSENDLEEYTDKSPNDIYSEDEYLDLNTDVQADWKTLQNVRSARNMFVAGQGLQPENPQSWSNQYSQLTHHIKNVSGIYGFFSSLFTPDKETKAVYADASRAYGWESRFYDSDRGATFMGIPGILVGDQGANEVIRRFITRKESNKKIFNPIPNEFAGSDFLPGADEYTNLQAGDPKSIKGGMFRLPGEAYRRIHPMRLLTVNAEDAVGSSEDLVSSLIRPGFFSPDSVGHVFAKIKPIVGDNIDTSVSYDNKEYNLKAFADAVLNNQNGSKTPILVRNLTGDEFSSVQSSGPREEEQDYLSIINKLSGTSKGMAIYINPDTGEKSVQDTSFSDSRFNKTMEKISTAREDVLQLIKSRVISEADIYDPVTKFDIASDVAPYSSKTRALASVISASDGVPEEDWKKFQAIKKRTSKQKKQTDVFQYRFNNINDRVMRIGGKVETVGDDGAIYFEGEDTPVKLAGGRISIGKVREYLAERNLTTPDDQSEMAFFLGLFGVKPGRAFSMTVDKDAPYERRKDLLHTRRAIIGHVNEKLIEEGIIDPKDTDDSPTTLLLKYNKKDITLGSILETIAHADTPFNTKFLRVRSPLEAYKRQVVYGTTEGDWQHPYESFIAPTFSAIASKNPFAAVALGASLGSFFGITIPAKLLGAKVGGTIGLAASLLRIGHESITGQAWMPPSVNRRRELEEYFDILKYIKERHLYEKKATEAQEVEGTDVREMVRKSKDKADKDKLEIEVLLEEKRKLYKIRKTEDVKTKLKNINSQIKDLSSDQGIVQLGPIATEALLHRQNYRSTLYGAKSNTALMDIMSAMPKNERSLLMEAIKSPDKEREQIYDLLSKPQQRVLGLFLGKRPKDLPARPQLNQYFEHHQLPGEDSAVWSEDVDIEDLKIRALAEEMPRKIELGIFPQSVTAAEDRTKFVEVPYANGRSSRIQEKLNNILSNSNVSHYSSAQFRHTNKNEVYVNTTVHQDRTEDYKDHINRRM